MNCLLKANATFDYKTHPECQNAKGIWDRKIMLQFPQPSYNSPFFLHAIKRAEAL